MKKNILFIALILSNAIFAGPIDSCLANVDMAIRSAANTAAAGGYAGTSRDITNRMRIAMSKGNCYGNMEQSALPQLRGHFNQISIN